MITEKTIETIWKCQREIRVAEELLVKMKEIDQQIKSNEHADRIKDAFGREQDLQLGIPSGSNSHRLISVSPSLSVSIINAHIANMKAKLIEANEMARIELNK